MNRVLLSLVVVVLSMSAVEFSVHGQQKASGVLPSLPPTATIVRHADPAKAEALIKEKKVVVLDVRTAAEYGDGHLADAKNIDFNGPDFEKQVAALDRNKNYLVHCASGGRSTRSLEIFKKLQFRSIVHLDGGFKAWQKEGKPVQK